MRRASLPATAMAATSVALVMLRVGSVSSRAEVRQEKNDTPARPVLYEALREAQVEHIGEIRNRRLQIDRFDFELNEGQLYLAPTIGGVVSTAVFVGKGAVRAFPPDAVEHHQLKKFTNEHHFEERFDRFVLRATDHSAEQLRALATPSRERERDTQRANRLVSDRREQRLERQRDNPDSRVLDELLRREVGTQAPGRAYRLVELDSKDHGWLTIEIDPNETEEVVLYRHDHRRRLTDTWMRFDILSDFDAAHVASQLAGLPIDPDTLDDDVTGTALGLPVRPLEPHHEGWLPRADVPLTQIDLVLDGDGDTRGTAALLVKPLEPMRSLRLRVSPALQVTELRWRTEVGAIDLTAPLFKPMTTPETGVEPRPNEPAGLTGESLPFAQEHHERFLEDDWFEPWVTVVFPRLVGAGEQVVVELAFEGALVERLRQTRDFVLKDTLDWRPQHPDTRVSRIDATFRVPARYRIASGGELVDERVEDETRITRWVTSEPVRGMAFHYGQFEVSNVERASPPRMTIYADENHVGAAPGNREKTIADLTGSIDLFSDYFGPFPYETLLVTETEVLSGQAFPGLLFLSYSTFGRLHTGEAELFRAHEVAHQWWGAAVDWRDYRDQWMSEGFAHYAAALYALQGLNQEEQFQDMINAWRLDVIGEGQVGQGIGLKHYGYRPEAFRHSDGHDSGALVVGYRLTSTETPFDYRIVVYEKGAYVLHMLRSMLLDPETGDDSRFRQMMGNYARAHVRRVMSTGSFEAVVNEAFGEPMGWFFDQWIYGVEVPTYRVDLDVSPVADNTSPYMLHGTVRQEDVSDGFKMPVPVRLTFDDRPPMTQTIWVNTDEVTVELPLPARPKDIEFNADHAVLARVR